jgi:hypothetical protein
VPDDETPTNPDPSPETNSDYDRIFGSGGEATGGGSDEGFLFDPTDAGPGRVEPGTYRAKVLEPPVRQLSQAGNLMMKTTFVITEGKYKDALQWKRFMLQGRGGSWTKEFLEAIGLPEEAAGTKPIHPRTVEGRHCLIGVRVQKNDPDFDEVYQCKPHPAGVWGGEPEPF